ncbi:MAG: nuclear transport factor 2 family protein [Polyangiaceae bacterium]|nr:nuclear transport factor 2 family protein [Polyangiaceae bacterium]
MSAIQNLVQRYLDSFNQTDSKRRRALIEEVYIPNVVYTDPMATVSGHEGIDQFLAGVQKQFAGVVFTLAGSVDAHHDVARFTWHAGPPGAAEPLAIGFDVVVVENGRIRQVAGFIDKAPGM